MECIFDINLMEFKIINDFLPKEELEKLDNRDFSDDIREAKVKGRIVVSKGDWNETVKAVKAKMAANATKTITIRVPVRVIERYKKRAAAVGIGYQTLMKQML